MEGGPGVGSLGLGRCWDPGSGRPPSVAGAARTGLKRTDWQDPLPACVHGWGQGAKNFYLKEAPRDPGPSTMIGNTPGQRPGGEEACL